MQWNDTSDLDTIARYNIIGLIPNIKYYVYDNDIFKYTLTTDHSGDLESFIIDLPASEEHEIKVKIICDYLIFNSDIPYTITENNKYYCLLSDSFDISDQIAITFASGVQNLTLDCLNHIIDGIDTDDTYGIYSEQYNTTVKNCILTDFYDGIYLRFSDYNILTNITANSNYAGIELYYSDNNIIINSAFNSNDYGIRLSTSSDNNIITDNNINSTSERRVYIWDNSNNTITGGSIASNIDSDYYLYSAGTTNNFINTNFAATRKIRFSTTTSWFNYRNDIAINIWLKTNVSNIGTISRELISWSQSLMQWNDTSDEQTTARYNITGLISNTNYYVYNNSVSTYSLNSGDNGKISFIINLPQNEEHEIKVNTTS